MALGLVAPPSVDVKVIHLHRHVTQLKPLGDLLDSLPKPPSLDLWIGIVAGLVPP